MSHKILIPNDAQTSFRITFGYESPSAGAQEKGTNLLLDPDDPGSVEIEAIELVYTETEEIIAALDWEYISMGRIWDRVGDWIETKRQEMREQLAEDQSER